MTPSDRLSRALSFPTSSARLIWGAESLCGVEACGLTLCLERYPPLLSGRYQERHSARRPKAIGSAGEVALDKIGCGYVLGLRETGVAGQRQHLGRAKETEEGCPGCSRGFLDRLILRALVEFDERQRQHERRRSEERRVGKECRSRWSPYH